MSIEPWLISPQDLKSFQERFKEGSQEDINRKSLLNAAKFLISARERLGAELLLEIPPLDTCDTFLSDLALLSALDDPTNLKHIAKVCAWKDDWHAGFSCEPNTNYGIQPERGSLYTLGRRGQGPETWEFGRDNPPIHFRDCTQTPHGLPDQFGQRRIRIGFPWVLIWHHRPNDSAIPELFNLFYQSPNVVIGPDGGSMHFYIADEIGAYDDNDGHCLVYVREI